MKEQKVEVGKEQKVELLVKRSNVVARSILCGQNSVRAAAYKIFSVGVGQGFSMRNVTGFQNSAVHAWKPRKTRTFLGDIIGRLAGPDEKSHVDTV